MPIRRQLIPKSIQSGISHDDHCASVVQEPVKATPKPLEQDDIANGTMLLFSTV